MRRSGRASRTSSSRAGSSSPPSPCWPTPSTGSSSSASSSRCSTRSAPAAGGLLFRLANYLPNLLLALGILVFGSLLARVVGAVVYTYLNNIGSTAAEPIGALARLAVLAFVLFTAAEQLAIETRVLVSAFQIAFGALCFALAIAFGLGGRDWASSVIDRYTRK
ncbi:MAG: hypothetical protein R2712_24340 [Vicinamibacterales bacterium]